MVARQPRGAAVGRLATVTRRQFGLFTWNQALAAGLTPAMIKSRSRAGTFVRVHRGVYRLGGSPRSWRQDVLAAVMWGGDDAVASHATAAKLWRFPLSPSAVEITVRARRTAPSPHIKVHRGLVAAKVVIEGIPATNAARTLLDIANRLEPSLLEAFVDDAISRRVTTPANLEWELSMSGGRRRSGSKALRASIAHLKDGHCESALENKVLRLLIGAGLPAPKGQYEIRSGDFSARVDFAYPQAKLAIEVDGFQYHSDRQAFERDRRRDAKLKSLDWQVLRITDRFLREPHDFLAAVRRSLGDTLF